MEARHRKLLERHSSKEFNRYYAATSRRTILAFLLLIHTVIYSVLPAGVLYCLSEKCGITLWHCCCEDSSSYKGQCAVHSGSGPSITASISGNDCNCEMFLSISPACDLVSPFEEASYKPFMFLAMLPAPIADYFPPVQSEKSVSQNETRGPPSQWVIRSSNSLRAPPVA